PWHLWKFFEDYPKAEMALSTSEYQRANKSIAKLPRAKVRILAILGNSKGIDLRKDRAFLEQLSTHSEIKFLVEPQPEQLNNQLWQQNWDILFFAGHSHSQEKGVLQLNQKDRLTLDKLKYALSKAITGGLKLAIFNSCDGLGLAQDLADLHIPQVIVMREPVPDVVAQEFLRHFLVAFSSGHSLYASVREARERLQKLEGKYPCATWLPVICQNPAEVPPTWQELCGVAECNSTPDRAELPSRLISDRRLPTVLLLSMAVTALVMGVRYLGMLQTWELQAFDQILQLRPDEQPDLRLLVVTVTEADIKAQNPEQRRGSLSDVALDRLLQKLEPFKPRAIGLDIYRDFPVVPGQTDLDARLRQSERLIAVCKVSDPGVNEPGIPPPPEIPPERLGFSDFVVDPDGIVRRHLLALTPDPASSCTTPYAFSVQLAFRYLAVNGIFPKYTSEGFLQLGRVVFKPLEAHAGGYQQVDTWGHQVLLNYRHPRSPQNIAAQVTLTQVLTGQINPNSVKDRIIAIGTTANSLADNWLTPYRKDQWSEQQQVPGVLVQAQMVSQILSAVLDRRP
ncbi:MAG: CHASE2 domain-containing protein, partial [Microcystaceae cyanobacterium]